MFGIIKYICYIMTLLIQFILCTLQFVMTLKYLLIKLF